MLIKDLYRLGLRKTRLFFFTIWETLYHPAVAPADDCEIDVVIAIVEKDLPVLHLCIEGLRKNVSHPIKQVYLVAPENQAIKDFAAANGLQFINETTVLGYPPARINYTVTTGKGLNRSGWIFQQLIKLSGKVGTCRYYLAIDSDHVLLQPHVFLSGGKTVFYQSFDNNLPYYNNIKRLMGYYPVHWFSYVSHKMLFDKEILKQLHHTIEQRSGKRWDDAIIQNLKTNEHSDFSEFELYGHFVAKDKKIHVPWREKPLHIENMTGLAELQKRYPAKLSATFSSYLHTPVLEYRRSWKTFFMKKAVK